MTTLTALDIAELRDPVEEYCGVIAQRHRFEDWQADVLIDTSRRLRRLGMSRAATCASIRKVAGELWAHRALNPEIYP